MIQIHVGNFQPRVCMLNVVFFFEGGHFVGWKFLFGTVEKGDRIFRDILYIRRNS